MFTILLDKNDFNFYIFAKLKSFLSLMLDMVLRWDTFSNVLF
jgi:hypothetical protein